MPCLVDNFLPQDEKDRAAAWARKSEKWLAEWRDWNQGLPKKFQRREPRVIISSGRSKKFLEWAGMGKKERLRGHAPGKGAKDARALKVGTGIVLNMSALKDASLGHVLLHELGHVNFDGWGTEKTILGWKRDLKGALKKRLMGPGKNYTRYFANGFPFHGKELKFLSQGSKGAQSPRALAALCVGYEELMAEAGCMGVLSRGNRGSARWEARQKKLQESYPCFFKAFWAMLASPGAKSGFDASWGFGEWSQTLSALGASKNAVSKKPAI